MTKRWIAYTLLLLMGALPAHAQSGDDLIAGTKLCTRHLPRYERQYGIPTHLLSAIASTESGRYHEGLGLRLPWPWTINAEGKGYYFDTKPQAIAAAQRLRRQGVRSMDVGCMQVNLMHHPEAFASLDQAFDPERNIAYAAGFLRNLYESEKSWKGASAGYHSKTPVLGRNYASRVYDHWYRIIDKLRAAKLQVPETSVAALNDMKTLVAAPLPPREQAKTLRMAKAEPRKAARKSIELNSMRITTRKDSQDDGVIIVKPDIKFIDSPPVAANGAAPEILTRNAPITLADAGAASAVAPSSGARIIRVNGESNVKSTTVKTGGPNFVFSD